MSTPSVEFFQMTGIAERAIDAPISRWTSGVGMNESIRSDTQLPFAEDPLKECMDQGKLAANALDIPWQDIETDTSTELDEAILAFGFLALRTAPIERVLDAVALVAYELALLPSESRVRAEADLSVELQRRIGDAIQSLEQSRQAMLRMEGVR